MSHAEEPPEGGPPSDGPAPEEPHPAHRRRRALGALAVVLVAGLATGAAIAATRGAPEPPAPTTPPTTSSTTTLTVPAPDPPEVLPAGVTAIATVKDSLDHVIVRSEPPHGWEHATPVLVNAPRDLPPSSRETAGDRPALPRPDLPVQGRFAVDGGWRFSHPGPYDPPQPLSMSVIEHRGGWLEVLVPVRPNGTHGWVRERDVEVTRTSQRIEIRLGERTMRVIEDGRTLIDTPVVVGADATATPTGVFYVTDVVPQRNPAGAYGPVAIATNGYSEKMDYFVTGVPVIAIHGTNRPALVGQAVSNGCIRVPNEHVTRLAELVERGAPVLIWP